MLFVSFAVIARSQSVSELSEKYEPVFQKALDWLAAQGEVKSVDPEREATLKTLDAPLLEPLAVQLPATGRFFRARMAAFLQDFQQTNVASGAVVWKLYNHSVVIRSPEATIAIDLISGMDRIAWDPATLNKAISGIDVLLITHSHNDHADMRVVKKFIAAGKPVLAPPGLWESLPQASGITYIRDGEITIKNIRITVFPSFQGMDPNNAYLVETTDGVRIMHIGDEGEKNATGKEWYARFKEPLHVDLLIPNCWSPNIDDLLRFVAPSAILPSHEFEITHFPSSRATYDAIYSKYSKLNIPFFVSFWGEKLIIKAAR